MRIIIMFYFLTFSGRKSTPIFFDYTDFFIANVVHLLLVRGLKNTKFLKTFYVLTGKIRMRRDKTVSTNL